MKAVLVTGTSSGIGQATALALDKAGFKVYAGVRNDQDAQLLRKQASNQLVPVILDVTIPEHIQKIAAQLQEELKGTGLYGLVNNAGVAVFTPIEALQLTDLRHVFDINFFGMVALTQALIPLLRQAKGRIINMGSVGAHTTIPFGFALCASKHAVESFTTGLRIELSPWHIDVVGIDPSAIKTEGSARLPEMAQESIHKLSAQQKQYYEKALTTMAKSMHQAEMAGLPATGVADVIVRAMTAKKPKTHYCVGPHAKQMVFFSGLLPDRWFDALKLKLVGIKIK